MNIEGSGRPGRIRFPNVVARDLEGREVTLPDHFASENNLVVVAFERHQQATVDTWIAWFEGITAAHPTLRCYEVPVIATRWSPARSFIDGGMARAVREREARRRTLTVYTDVRHVTDALAIGDTRDVTALLVGSDGGVRWRATGPVSDVVGSELSELLAASRPSADGGDVDGDAWSIEQFGFAFDPRFRKLLALVGVTPGTAHVTLTPERFVVRFGPWSCETALTNVRAVCETGPYHWYRAIGARGSFADRGVTFGTTAAGGVCVLLREPVPGLTPFDGFRHPGITLTVAEPDRFVASWRRRADLG